MEKEVTLPLRCYQNFSLLCSHRAVHAFSARLCSKYYKGALRFIAGVSATITAVMYN